MGHKDKGMEVAVASPSGICGTGRPDWHRPCAGQGCGAPGAPGVGGLGGMPTKAMQTLGSDASNSNKKLTKGVNRHVVAGKILANPLFSARLCRHTGMLMHQNRLSTWL